MFFQLSWRNKPCFESLKQICLDGVEKQNKTYSFKVSIGLLPLFFDCHTKNKPCSKSLEHINLHGVEKQNKTYSFEVSIGLLPLFLSNLFRLESRNGTKYTILKLVQGCYPSLWLSWKKWALLWKFGADLFRWSWETEQNIQFWS